MRRADNLTTFMCRLSWNLGASTSRNPQGLSRPVMGLLYLFSKLQRDHNLSFVAGGTRLGTTAGLVKIRVTDAPGRNYVCTYVPELRMEKII